MVALQAKIIRWVKGKSWEKLRAIISRVNPNARPKMGAIIGVGSTTSFSSVRWGVAGRIVWAWVLTIPAAALIAATCQFLFRLAGWGGN